MCAAVLTGAGHDGRVYAVTGREALSLGEIAATLAELSGKPIRYVDETIAEARASRAHYGAPDWQLEAWISTYTAIASGALATVSDTVARLTGHPQITLADYVRANPDCLTHVVEQRPSAIRPRVD